MVRLLCILTAALAALLAGCSTQHTVKQAFQPHVSRAELDPLLDAPLRMQTVCQGRELFSAGQKLGGFSFSCPDLDVVATLNELRDAGWRVEKMNIGKLESANDKTGSPLTCTLRKVY
jgi:hypothetical protein